MLAIPNISQQKADAIALLQKDILLLQSRPALRPAGLGIGLGAINNVFPDGSFPTGAVHEFCCPTVEGTNASTGFLSGIVATLMGGGGACVWASPRQSVFPPALAQYGIEPDKVVFINLQKERDLVWAIEEALKCNGLAAVVGEVQGLSFMASRRLQLAVEASRVTGFVLRRNTTNMEATACAARWGVSPLPSTLDDGMPGVGHPRWRVELLKVRNGRGGSWDVEWADGRFNIITDAAPMVQYQRRAI